ncbi:MAG: hypothetical protein WCI26_11425, partial [Acidimicrobiales bacterium]
MNRQINAEANDAPDTNRSHRSVRRGISVLGLAFITLLSFVGVQAATQQVAGAAVPTTPFIDPLPASGIFGGAFTPTVTTDSDGATSVTSDTTSVCTVTVGVVDYIGVGTCTLVAHVAATIAFEPADGTPQDIVIAQATPATLTIDNLPLSGTFGGGFSATVNTDSDGDTSVTSTTPLVCTVTVGVVDYIGVGTCTLVAHVTAGTNYLAADGSDQDIIIAQATPATLTIDNLPASGIFGGGFTPNVTTDGDGDTSVTSTTPLVCTVTVGVVDYIGIGTCTLVAHVTAGTNYLAADGSDQDIVIAQAAPSTPTISNLPASGIFDDGFTPTVSTNGDGVKSVTSTTPLVCTVTVGVVDYIGIGTCTLVAHVAAGTNYLAANGSNQNITIAQAAPSTPTISNLPASGIFGDNFTPIVSTNGDGDTSVTSNTPLVCTVTVGVVDYVAVGTCTLVAHVTAGTNYLAADGSDQDIAIAQAAPATLTIDNLPPSGIFGGGFTPSVTTDGDGDTSVTSNTPLVCTVT